MKIFDEVEIIEEYFDKVLGKPGKCPVERLLFTTETYIPRMIADDRMRIYVAGPLSAETKEQREVNIRRADAIGRELFIRGHYPFVPHTQAASWFEDPHPLFQDYNALVADHDILGWLSVCDAVIFIEGWEDSKGSRMEHDAAVEFGKKIFYHLRDIPDVRSKT